jgi:hypothetical protein
VLAYNSTSLLLSEGCKIEQNLVRLFSSFLRKMICFSDASHSPQHRLAVIGFRVKHELKMHFQVIRDVSCPTSEKAAAQACIEYCRINYPGQELIIFTDCIEVERAVWPEHVTFIRIPGHTKKALRNEDQAYFAAVDEYTRKQLREIVRTL